MQRPTWRLSIAVRIFVYGGLIALLLWLALRPGIHDRALSRQSQLEIVNLTAAMESHRLTYGFYPAGNNAAILGQLRGTNPRRMIFLDVNPRFLGAGGVFIDPWQTPYDIKIVSTNKLAIRSAGQNRRFGDEDDVIGEQ